MCKQVLANYVVDVHASREGASAKRLHAQRQPRDDQQGDLLFDRSRRDVQEEVRNQSLGENVKGDIPLE